MAKLDDILAELDSKEQVPEFGFSQVPTFSVPPEKPDVIVAPKQATSKLDQMLDLMEAGANAQGTANIPTMGEGTDTESVIGSALSPIIGPTEQERMRGGIPVENEDGTISYEYKPQGNRFEQEGILAPPAKTEDVIKDFGLEAVEGESDLKSFGKGVGRATVGILNSLQSPVALPFLAAGGAEASALKSIASGVPVQSARTILENVPTLNRTVAGGFAGQMATSVPEQVRGLAESQNLGEVAERGIGLAATGAFAGLGAKYALSPRKLAQIETAASADMPATAAELAKQSRPNVTREVLLQMAQEHVAKINKAKFGEEPLPTETRTVVGVNPDGTPIFQENAEVAAPNPIQERVGQRPLTEQEKAELNFLERYGDNPEVIAERFGYNLVEPTKPPVIEASASSVTGDIGPRVDLAEVPAANQDLMGNPVNGADFQSLVDQRNKLFLEELPKQGKGTNGEARVLKQISDIDEQLRDAQSKINISIAETNLTPEVAAPAQPEGAKVEAEEVVPVIENEKPNEPPIQQGPNLAVQEESQAAPVEAQAKEVVPDENRPTAIGESESAPAGDGGVLVSGLDETLSQKPPTEAQQTPTNEIQHQNTSQRTNVAGEARSDQEIVSEGQSQSGSGSKQEVTSGGEIPPAPNKTPKEYPNVVQDRGSDDANIKARNVWAKENIPTEQWNNTSDLPPGKIVWSTETHSNALGEYGKVTNVEESTVFQTKDGRVVAIDPSSGALREIPATDPRIQWDANAVEQYGITLPEGYIREGDLYVYKPKNTPEVVSEKQAESLTDKPVTAEVIPEARVEPVIENKNPENPEPPNLGPRAANAQEFVPQGKVGAYNAKVDEQRAARGLEPLMSRARESNPTTWDAAVERIERDPESPARLVEDILSGDKKTVSRDEQAELLWRLTDLRNKLEQETERSIDESATPEERKAAEELADSIERQLRSTEEADRVAGSHQGAALQFRQVLANEDYTFGGIMRKMRKSAGRELTAKERAKIKEQADKIAELQKKADEQGVALEKAKEQEELSRVYQETIRDLKTEREGLLKQAESFKIHPRVLDYAERIVTGWESAAAQAELRMMKRSETNFNSALDAEVLFDLTVMARGKLGRTALNAAQFSAEMIAKYGEHVRPYLDKAWAAAKEQVENVGAELPEQTKKLVRKVISKAGSRKGDSVTDIKARAKAESLAGEELSHKTVYDLARAHVKAGVRGEDAVMKAVHDDVLELYPDATERDVRRAFSEYGKVKFPSKDADKAELREIRTLVRLQESIDRLTENRDALHSGLQRDKATLAIREKQRQLNELLKKRQGPPSPEKLASRDEARKTAILNQIEILDKQLRTGEKPIKGEPLPDSTEVEALKAERNAMREKLDEIEHGETPRTPEHIQELNRIQDRIDETRDRLARLELDRPKAEGKETVDTKEISEAKAELKLLNDTLRDLRKPEPVSDAQKALDTAMVARERAAQTLDDISTGKLKPNSREAKEALTQLEEDIRLETEAMKVLAAEMRRDAKPKADPNHVKEQAQIKALETAIAKYEEKTAKGDFSEKGGATRPDTQKVAAVRAIRDARKAVYDAAKKASRPILTPEERYNKSRIKALNKREAELLERLRTGNYAPRPKPVNPKLNKDALDAKARVDTLKREVDMKAKEELLRQRPLWKKALSQLGQVRGIILGSDIGVLTRQGLFSWSRPVTAIRATKAAIDAAFSPEAMGRWEVETRDRKINGEDVLPMEKEAGLQITDTLNHPEELVITRLISRIPDFKVAGKTIKLSAFGKTLERFQTTFINAVRRGMFDSAVRQGMTPEELKLRANFINSVTGRSNIKMVPSAMQAILTSPRYEASRWETLAQPFRNIGSLAKNGIKGELNKSALANLQDLTVTAAGIVALFMAAEKAAGYQVNWDPTSTDFLKMRRGNDVWDVSAGLAPRIRDIMRLYVAMTHPDYKNNIGKTLLNMVVRTINPAITTSVNQSSVAVQKVRGDEEQVLPLNGFRSEDEREGLITLAPLIVQSTKQALADEGIGAAAWTALREFVGSSSNRYPAPDSKKEDKPAKEKAESMEQKRDRYLQDLIKAQ